MKISQLYWMFTVLTALSVVAAAAVNLDVSEVVNRDDVDSAREELALLKGNGGQQMEEIYDTLIVEDNKRKTK